mmetsp:Transcript_6030/g.10277  ORF Transcript_6030/g.10277 Transcript_6030/m.10277 type:complete len:126 (-) Transcript_6030:408-785(-)
MSAGRGALAPTRVYVPTGAREQFWAPSVSFDHLPLSHLEHEAEPAAANVPVSQIVHDDEPVDEAILPAAHEEQFVCPFMDWKCPAEHCEHSVLPPREYLPASHSEHALCPVLDCALPGGHSLHAA